MKIRVCFNNSFMFRLNLRHILYCILKLNSGSLTYSIIQICIIFLLGRPISKILLVVQERNSVIGDSDVSQRSNDTVNFTRLSSSDDPTAVLPDSARYLAGMFKTTTEQVSAFFNKYLLNM